MILIRHSILCVGEVILCLQLVDVQLKLEHTSEEVGFTPKVVFGRGHLVLYVAKDCFGDFIKSLGTILHEKGNAIQINKGYKQIRFLLKGFL